MRLMPDTFQQPEGTRLYARVEANAPHRAFQAVWRTQHWIAASVRTISGPAPLRSLLIVLALMLVGACVGGVLLTVLARCWRARRPKAW